ncbi:MAG: YdcH family protein [Parvularcula sp.]
MSDDEVSGPHLVSIDGDASETREETSTDLAQQGANDEAVRIQLAKVEAEHKDLDAAILSLEERMPYDRMTIQRLKKRKLALKDEMTRLHALLLPDIIA